MRLSLISILLLLLLSTFVAHAAQITVGFEDLQSVCGRQDYNSCNADVYGPYFQKGMVTHNGRIMNETFGDQMGKSIFPDGSYYLNLGDQYEVNGVQQVYTAINFVDPYRNGAPRSVDTVSFTVLGKTSDALSGARGGVGPTASGEAGDSIRLCNTPSACPDWFSGFHVIARDVAGHQITDYSVSAVSYGMAGYDTGVQGVTNIRVTLTGINIHKLEFGQYKTRDINGNWVYGVIAIDDITFEEAVQGVPEPGTFATGALVLGGLALLRVRRRKSTQA